ncbi:hypothetical protein K1T71_009643 [Dendrolimus kikuchii]|uniref:Uncharacterized protein n=1 Tax=Dendrolimus kikuchii TaxID=765133 RepID=A0ACC1CSN9_9NEOP|nr:hypothetical protein K1T71_009643 [Dendrolimus kikuchii]
MKNRPNLGLILFKYVVLGEFIVKTYSLHGHTVQVENQTEKERKEEIALAKQYKKLKRQAKADDAIKKARQLIFQESCYGKRLLSAFIESKTLEERDVQEKFLNKLKKKAAKMNKLKSVPNKYCTFDLDKKSEDREHQKKLALLECIRLNNEHKKLKEEKLQRQKQDDVLTESYRIEQEKNQCKIKRIINET